MNDPYCITLQPGANADQAAVRLARYIVNRWRPNNQGGIHFLVGPQLAAALMPFFEKANERKRPYQIGVMYHGLQPEIVDLQGLSERG